MDISSIMMFLIYIIVILMILLYISPILSVLLLLLVPIASAYFLPQWTIPFFSKQQFLLFGDIPVQNLHILLLIWSAVIGVVASTEIMSWYLLRSEKPTPKVGKQTMPEKPAVASAPLKPGESQKSLKVKVEDLLLKLGKIMSGRKS